MTAALNHHGAGVSLRDVESMRPLALTVAMDWAERRTERENERIEEARKR